MKKSMKRLAAAFFAAARAVSAGRRLPHAAFDLRVSHRAAGFFVRLSGGQGAAAPDPAIWRHPDRRAVVGGGHGRGGLCGRNLF